MLYKSDTCYIIQKNQITHIKGVLLVAKWVYDFNEGHAEMKELLGGKGANLAELMQLNVPVPDGFTVTTEACVDYLKDGQLSESVKEEILNHLKDLEERSGKSLTNPNHLLLVSVRSGAQKSMPGMMDTILNLGLTDKSVKGLAQGTNNESFAYDCYRRLIQMFGNVVHGIPEDYFEGVLSDYKADHQIDCDQSLNAKDLIRIIELFKQIYLEETKTEFPQNPFDQLLQAIEAVFQSWNNERAVLYRELHQIPHNWGTAVNIQEMVYGNMGENSGTGVLFTRHPATGHKEIFGEYLMNAQGEDVVAGVRTPVTINELKTELPKVYQQLEMTVRNIEDHFKNMQDIEFTIEDGQLFILQTRNGKRTGQAAVTIAVDLHDEGKISKEDALLMVEPQALVQILHPSFSPDILAKKPPLAQGLAASPGAVSGQIYFHSDDSVRAAENKQKVIIVRHTTSPEDLAGMTAAEGILTACGGMTSHAAVVSRGMGKCCVAGATSILVDEERCQLKIGDRIFSEGDWLSLDGSTGCVYEGILEQTEPVFTPHIHRFMQWVDEKRRIGVMANADTPHDVRVAVEFGAEGIGLCRTEHMFFDRDRIMAVREMIFAKTMSQREKALDKILPYQEEDFYHIYKEVEGLPVTVRLLDPPLHEFLPHDDGEMKELAEFLEKDIEEVQERMKTLQEINPMLGHRGCRLAITYPEIYRMQARAIIQAALRVQAEGISIQPEIMIPLVMDAAEYEFVKNEVDDEIEQVFAEKNDQIEYKVGAMIEVPRAALLSDEIARESDFFSYGTNDLTQMTYGFSRDDADKFIHEYEEKELLERSPFGAVDQKGVGELLKISIERARQTKPNLRCGICGEDGGDPASVAFFDRLNYSYVSCSPYRIPIARLASAHSALKYDTITK